MQNKRIYIQKLHISSAISSLLSKGRVRKIIRMLTFKHLNRELHII